MTDQIDTVTGSQRDHYVQKPGQLRIFLGYANGVGKTYAMLESAQRRKAQGVDVVIGSVDTHDQPEIRPLLMGLEWVRSSSLHEKHDLDVDAILARRPQLVLVDELEHVNSPEARHPQRYQDVEDLLEAGIDVYATVNVQHIESLNDVVHQITGVAVKHTIPDSIFQQAHQIELIDIPPEDLVQHIEEGRVKLPEGGSSAERKLYRLGNLVALRELAMRQAAHQVDEQMRSYMQTRSIPGPWAAADHLLVCISTSPLSARLVRTGCRLAQELDARWHVVYVEVPSTSAPGDEDLLRLHQTMGLAESLGARVETITGESIAEGVLRFARQNNVTKIVIGQPPPTPWYEFFRKSIVNEIIRYSGKIDVYVISAYAEETDELNTLLPTTQRIQFSKLFQALLVVALSTLAGGLVNSLVVLDPANLVMFYLLAVVIVALRLGYGAAVMTAVLSVIAFNYFFVPPRFTLHVASPQYLLTFLGLFVAGWVIANLTSRAQRQTEAAQRRERETAQLYSLSRELSATIDPSIIMQTILQHAWRTFHCEAAVFLLEDDQLVMRAAFPGFVYNDKEHEVALWTCQHARPAGRGTNTMRSSNVRYVPLKTAHKTVGVLGLMVSDTVPLETQRLIDAFATQAALALEATQLGEQVQQAKLLREKEKLQSVLLNSISHDLRTPLVSITGTLSSLRENDGYFDAASRRDLLDGAYQEADRLNRLVGNLLDMSRLEAGSLKLKQEPYDVPEMIGVARAQLRERLRGRVVHTQLPDDLPMVPVDLVLITQVLVNLLDNALKYSEPGTPIDISAQKVGQSVEITIADRGVGVSSDEIPYIFEKFYRAKSSSGRGGSGLGLSICQGIVEAHNGSIRVESREGGGTCFIITLPLT